ncbi:MAG: hypothetical protein Q9215_003059 [Flavoplaca cf. flavocitrina]
MATIKPIEGRSVHQIQSGQVIVDLCSVVKELVENSLDAGATSIGKLICTFLERPSLIFEEEVRFKGNGLDAIEVQDNGTGISKENYDTVGKEPSMILSLLLFIPAPALKHHTSKLSTYDDISSLQTFGFRGEALSSLSALSNFQIVTAQAHEAPKGTKLDFEPSGKLRTTAVVASQRGTTVTVEALFANLPVRRRELEKNIKREYTKVLGVLQAYSCISTSVKFSVSNVLAKGKKNVVFATKSNTATRENIANVFGVKTLTALVSMDLRFDLQGSKSIRSTAVKGSHEVRVVGHVSRPVIGDGRQAPDRQMFFVNERPCTLPQFAKVFNEVYKAYNVSQSPFVFANIVIDTNAYDVNVSPDKKTILLHDRNALLESLRVALVELFEHQDQTIPQTQRPQSKLPVCKALTVQKQSTSLYAPESSNQRNKRIESSSVLSEESHEDNPSEASDQESQQSTGIIGKFAARDAQPRNPKSKRDRIFTAKANMTMGGQKLVRKLENSSHLFGEDHEYDDKPVPAAVQIAEEIQDHSPNPVVDFNRQIAEQQGLPERHSPGPSEQPNVAEGAEEEAIATMTSSPLKPASGVVQNAFERMRSRREPHQVATITIGEKTTTTIIGSTPGSRNVQSSVVPKMRTSGSEEPRGTFSSSVRAFAAPGLLSEASSYCNPTAAHQEVHKDVTPLNHAASESPVSAGKPLYNDDAPEDTCISSDDEEHIGREDESDVSDAGRSDELYVDDEARKTKQDAKVADLIREAEARSAAPREDNLRRAGKILKGTGLRDSTTQLLQTLHVSISKIEEKARNFESELQTWLEKPTLTERSSQFKEEEEKDAEHKLSLKVTKTDFSRIEIIGQFNLGFILVMRPSTSPTTDDELFIIDQHASDEKFNFERLQTSTTVQSQRLVRPKVLELTAIDEEIIIENNAALLENGFVVAVDQSGDTPVGQRCRVLSLPMSREVTFGLSDLEELISLLGESPPSVSVTSTDISGQRQRPRHIPRPSKIRKLFAMRACRCSVMIGKTLQKRQMEKLVRHMGEIDKPWNCPHGRPTMRHLFGLKSWEGWKEGDGLVEHADEAENEDGRLIYWGPWLAEKRNNEQAVRQSDNDHIESSEKEEDKEPWSENGVDTQGTEAHSKRADEPGILFDNVEDSSDGQDADECERDIEGTEESGDEDGLESARQSISQRFTFS